jgi:(2Fe-2S) ferredoxin
MKHFYTAHLFFCTNIRKDNQACCAQKEAESLYHYAKDTCRTQGLLGKGKIGISASRCLGRCKSGAVAVIYPDNIWYQCKNKTDVDEIIQTHLINNQVVNRLLI